VRLLTVLYKINCWTNFLIAMQMHSSYVGDIRPHQVSHYVRTFDAVLKNNCINFLYDAHLHPTFLFDGFKCLVLFTNLHFSSMIQHSCMETKCSSCLWIVSEFASHQYCFCVVIICGHYVHTKHKKEVLGKCFAPLKVGRVLTPVV